MKKSLMFIVVCGLTGRALAGSLSCTSTYNSLPSGYSAGGSGTSPSHCLSSYTGYQCNSSTRQCDTVQNCTSCTSGYYPSQITVPSSGVCSTVTFSSCCTQCYDCTSDTDYQYYSPGYLRKANRWCNCGVCETSYVYKCADGYYGNPGDQPTGCEPCKECENCESDTEWKPQQIEGWVVKVIRTCECDGSCVIDEIINACAAGYYMSSSGCTRCPGDGDSAVASWNITDCFIPGGQTLSDETGSYEYISDCYYSF